ncbi:DUF4145 domain-containing protein [Rhizobium ruizarguesonis]|uniref:DUF4145 domain-containing protein n=1 Tax=Rhizobium ruizarguesonis TaxID=2081791 RepID=UPI002962136F|nr:DUF4145 domain-containing protein [Rhizobium ruizarguesonis]
MELWRRSFANFPSYICPKCARGTISLVAETEKRMEARYAKREHAEKGYHPYNEVTRFSCLLQCSASSCGEVVAVSGDIVHDVEILVVDGEYQEEYTAEFMPRSMFPPPPVVRLPKKLPKDCSEHLKASFALMWSDTGACANRIRSFVEVLLDHFEIERKGPNKTGDIYRYSLLKRIKLFEAKKPGHETLYDALRIVGNLGSHEGSVKWDTLLQAFQLADYLIEVLIEDKGESMRAIAQEIVDKKGKM